VNFYFETEAIALKSDQEAQSTFNLVQRLPWSEGVSIPFGVYGIRGKN
jgi:hypothetical protein